MNFKSFSVDFNSDDLTFSVCYAPVDGNGEKTFIKSGKITVTDLNGIKLTPADFKEKNAEIINSLTAAKLRMRLTKGTVSTPELEIVFTASSHALTLFANGRAYTTFAGDFFWGEDMEHSTFSIRTGSQTPTLHTANGPATSDYDNALYDRLTDTMLNYSTAGKMRVRFDWDKKCYSFTHTNGLDHGKELKFTVKKNVLAEKFNIPYAPMDYSHQFKTPPVGWMTWYAVKFDCCKAKVYDNAEKFIKNFGKYTDNPVIWVDWEWCHKCFDGQGEEGADIFHPRKTAYPNGLAEVSEKIKSLGAIPALWTGATNEGALNDLLKANPDWVLGHKAIWCGQYWVDLTNPEVLEKYIKTIFRQILDWGYQVVKWDCLPATLEMLSTFHDNAFDKSLSPHQALRNAIKAARSVLGKERYLLSCSGSSERDTAFATDLFDAARIGNDIFTWEDYLDQAVNLVLHYYTLHNTQYYADADNLVLRSEFNNVEQARSRISFYGLAGLPVTLGDEIDALDDTRIDMLRRIMPTTSIRSADMEIKQRDNRYQLVNTAVAKPFGSWNVVGITNFLAENASLQINMADLQLSSDATYAVFDFWNQEFAGIYSSSIQQEIKPFDTKVLRITRLNDDPVQLIGSSRHILQGSVEVENITRQNNSCTCGVICVEGEDLVLTFHTADDIKITDCSMPFTQDGNICKVTVSGGGKTSFTIQYSK